jgi:hypothetical protein
MFSLRMHFSFGRPSCELALCCVWAPNLRTCLALRWGAQLADMRTCLAFALQTCVGAPNLRTCLRCVGAPNLRTCLALRCRRTLGRATCGRALRCVGAQLADRPCVAFGRPSCGRALHCVGAANLGEAVLKTLPPSQNLFLSILQLVFYPSAPLCGRFRCGSVFRLGAHLADAPSIAFGCPSCGRASRCVGAPNLCEAVLKSLPPSQKNFLSILQLVFSPSAPLCGRFRCG